MYKTLDKIIALAKFGYAAGNADKNLMSSIANWARGNGTSGVDWTLSATDPKSGALPSNWSPNQESWSDVIDFATKSSDPVAKQFLGYLTSYGLYNPSGISQSNSDMQASQAVNTQQQKSQGTWDYSQVTPDANGNLSQGTPIYQSPWGSSGSSVTTQSPVIIPTVTPATPATDPVTAALDTAKQYRDMALAAGNTKLDAQIAQAAWTIQNGGVWKTLQPIAQQQMQDALATLEKTSAIVKANVEASRAAMTAEEAANYDEVIKTIDQNLVASRQRTTEEMNQRGLFFSTVLDSVMGKVEAASATQRGQAAVQHSLTLAKIAAQMAQLSGNIDIETIKGNAAAVAQYTAQMLQVVAQDEQTKQTAQALLAGLNVEKSGIADTIGMEIFGTVQDIMRRGTQDAQAQQDRSWNDWLAGIGQYANNYQAEIDNQQRILSDPNATPEQKTLAAKKITALNEARTGKLGNAFETWKGTTNIYANDYQKAINELDPNDPLYAQKKSYLIGLRMDKIVGIAKTNAAQAQQELENAFKERQINVLEYQAMTARIKALGGGGSGTSGTTSKPAWTNAQARSFKAKYEKVMNMPIGTTIDSSVAGTLAGSGVNLNVGATWTPESRDAYLKQNKSLYDSAINFINTNDTSLWNPNNPQLSTTFRAMLQGMIDNGIMITEDNILRQIEAQGDYITPSGTPAGAEYEFLLAEFERLRNK